MKISEKNVKEESDNDLYDSDETLITDSQERKYRGKIQQKSQIEGALNTTTEQSESLFKIKKKKYSDMAGESTSSENYEVPVKKMRKNPVHFLTRETFMQPSSKSLMNSQLKKNKKKKRDSNLNGIIYGYSITSSLKVIKQENFSCTTNDMEDVYSAKNSTKKNKKKKDKGLNSIISQNDNSVEFLSHDNFKQSSSGNSMNSLPKKNKKKSGDINLNGNINGYSMTSSLKKIKQEKLSSITNDMEDVCLTENSTKRNKKKKDKGLNSIISQNENTVEFLSQDIFKQPSSGNSIDFPLEKKKKKSGDRNLNDNINGYSMTSPLKKIKQEKFNSTRNDMEDVCLPESSTKKKKDKGLNSIISQNENTVEFLSQDIFKKPSSGNSIDFPSEKKKKKSGHINLNGNINGHSITSPFKKIKQEKFNSTKNDMEDVYLTENSTKKNKKKKDKGLESILSQTDNIVEFLSQDIFRPHKFSSTTKDTQDVHLPENSTKKDKKKKDKRLDSIISQNDNNIEFLSQDIFRQQGSEEFMNSTPKKLKNKKNKERENEDSFSKSFSFTSYNKVVPELGDSEINMPCKKHKGIKQHKDMEIIENDTFRENEQNGSANFYCNFCQSSFKNISKDGDKDIFSVNSVNGRSSSETSDGSINKTKKKKRKHKKPASEGTGSNGKRSGLSLLEMYLDKEDALSDDDSKSVVVTNHSNLLDNNRNDTSGGFNCVNSKLNDFEPVNENAGSAKKKKRKPKEPSIERASVKEDDNILDNKDNLFTNNVSSELDNINYTHGILGVNCGKSVEKTEHPKYNLSDGTTKNFDTNGRDFMSSDEEMEEMDKLEILKSRLKGLDIEVNFPVPKLHEICDRASKPTAQQRLKLKAENISIRNGKFVKAEDVKIKENWLKFIELYNFDDVPEVFFSLDKKYIKVNGKRNFLFFLAQGLDDRTPFSVYQRFKLLMLQLKRGRFSAEEDKYILDSLEETGCRRNYITNISLHLQRPCHSVEKRIKRLKDRHTRKIKWRKANMAALVKYLLKVTGNEPDDVGKLKNRHISSQEWTRLAKKLDNIPFRILRRAWQEKIHPMLFIPGKCCDLREVKLKLINMFYENKEFDWRAVNWNYYASHFEGFTTLRLYSLMKTLVSSRVSRHKRDNLKKCIKVLRKCTIVDLPAHFIYKVKYENGEIRYLVDEETKTRK